MKDPLVILVDENDTPVGLMEKMEAHKKALLHRAVSVFIVNAMGEWILQKRALNKYHSQGLWTNACCTHPFPDESDLDSANRRLMEEMGMRCELREIFSFIYKEKLAAELTEYEFDHVFIGFSDDMPEIDTREVADWTKIYFEDLQRDIMVNPSNYTVWFKKIYQRVNGYLLNSENSNRKGQPEFL